MPFPIKLADAARRHLQAAELLIDTHRRDVAGYLFGIAAECAVKELARKVLPPAKDGAEDPMFLHFIPLRTVLRDALSGRRAGALTHLIFDDAFMNHWDVAMRYTEARQIEARWVKEWRVQAKAAVDALET